jgi:RNA polymerase sigma factor (TIGR02999 family)
MASPPDHEPPDPNEPSAAIPTSQSVTRLLRAWTDGDLQARDDLMALVYADLKRHAAAHLRHERADHTLQTTGLVHEAFLRLMGQTRVDWQNRAHFFGLAGQMMRRILVDHARERHAAKRPQGAVKIDLDEGVSSVLPPEIEVLMLDDALNELAAVDPRQARIVELKYFAGLAERDVAVVLSISRATVTREWQSARAWLFRRMTRRPRRAP